MDYLSEILHDIGANWPLYLAMPFIGALIGWGTKVLAVEMMFRPVEFVGKPPYLGWQGVIPRNSARMAGTAVDLMMARLLDPREIIESIDVPALLAEVDEPIRDAVEELVPELMRTIQPRLWATLPTSVQNQVINRVCESLPGLVDRFLTDLNDKLDQVVDIRALAVDALTRDKALTNRLIRTVGNAELAFIVRVGVPFGFALGLVQAVVWAMTHSPWIMPAFGAFTGLVTDWLALQMVFRPIKPKRYFGLVRWQGLFHKRREEVTRDYTALIANEIITPANLMQALLTGPRSDRFLFLIDSEIRHAIDEASGPMKPVVVLAMGRPRYHQLQSAAAEAIIERLHADPGELGTYAATAFDLPGLLQDKMRGMTDEEFEGLLRPAFKQDEWKLVTAGAILGFLIGELQVHLLLT